MIPLKNDSIFVKFSEYAIYLFLILFPFLTYASFLYTGTTTRAINLIIFSSVIGGIFSLWLMGKGNQVSFPKSPILLSLALYLGSITVSGLYGLSFENSFWSVATRMTGIWYFLCLGFFIFLLWPVVSDEIKRKKTIFLIITSTALFSILSILGPEGFGIMFKGYDKDGFTFGNTTFAGMYIFGAFILSLYYIFQAKNKKWWMYLIPLALVVNSYILNINIWKGDFTGGFTGEAKASAYVTLLSLGALLCIWFVSKIKDQKFKSRLVYSIFTLSVLAVVFSASSLLSSDGYLRKVYLSQAGGARPLVWEMSEKIIRERPFFGWGTDNFERVFETNYDNRILQDEYGNEAWFDRAHNVFVDQAVDVGIIGLIFYLLIYVTTLLSLIYTFLNSKDVKDQLLASVLIVYFALHFAELQTAFDTSISYIMLVFMLTVSAAIFHKTYKEVKGVGNEIKINNFFKYSLASIIFIFFSWSLVVGVFPFVRAQITNGEIRKVGSAQKRIPLYETLLGSQIDPHALLWRTSTDFQRGIGANPKVLEDPKKVEYLRQEIVILENKYKEYIKNNPTHFRAHLNLADVLIYQNLFQVNKLEEAQKVLDEAIRLVPQSPQPYWMKAVAYIYMGKFNLAREYAKKAFDLNPKIVESQNIIKYVEDSIKTFPEIDLYFFRQT